MWLGQQFPLDCASLSKDLQGVTASKIFSRVTKLILTCLATHVAQFLHLLCWAEIGDAKTVMQIWFLILWSFLSSWVLGFVIAVSTSPTTPTPPILQLVKQLMAEQPSLSKVDQGWGHLPESLCFCLRFAGKFLLVLVG